MCQTRLFKDEQFHLSCESLKLINGVQRQYVQIYVLILLFVSGNRHFKELLYRFDNWACTKDIDVCSG